MCMGRKKKTNVIQEQLIMQSFLKQKTSYLFSQKINFNLGENNSEMGKFIKKTTLNYSGHSK